MKLTSAKLLDSFGDWSGLDSNHEPTNQRVLTFFGDPYYPSLSGLLDFRSSMSFHHDPKYSEEICMANSGIWPNFEPSKLMLIWGTTCPAKRGRVLLTLPQHQPVHLPTLISIPKLNIEEKRLYLTLRSQGQPPFHISVQQGFHKTRYSIYHYSMSYAPKIMNRWDRSKALLFRLFWGVCAGVGSSQWFSALSMPWIEISLFVMWPTWAEHNAWKLLYRAGVVAFHRSHFAAEFFIDIACRGWFTGISWGAYFCTRSCTGYSTRVQSKSSIHLKSVFGSHSCATSMPTLRNLPIHLSSAVGWGGDSRCRPQGRCPGCHGCHGRLPQMIEMDRVSQKYHKRGFEMIWKVPNSDNSGTCDCRLRWHLLTLWIFGDWRHGSPVNYKHQVSAISAISGISVLCVCDLSWTFRAAFWIEMVRWQKRLYGSQVAGWLWMLRPPGNPAGWLWPWCALEQWQTVGCGFGFWHRVLQTLVW